MTAGERFELLGVLNGRTNGKTFLLIRLGRLFLLAGDALLFVPLRVFSLSELPALRLTIRFDLSGFICVYLGRDCLDRRVMKNSVLRV